MGRKRLRRRQLFAVGAALRHLALLDRPDRLAAVAVEHEDEALLGGLDHDVAHPLAGIDARQRRLRRQVVVPDIMVHGLERPHQLTGFDAQRHHRIGVVVVAGPLAAPEIRARRGCRQEHEPALIVHRHRRPDIGGAGGDFVVNQRVETPAQASAPRIEGAHGAERGIDPAIIRDGGTDHDDAAAHRRRRGDLEFARPFELPADLRPDLAIVAEIRARRARPGIERDDTGVVGAHEDPAAAGCAFSRLLVAPIGDAAADIAVGGTLAGADFRIVAPLLRPAAGIERNHLVERGADDQAVLDEQRRRLEFRPLHDLGRTGREIPGMEFPGPDELADIVGRDLGQRRKPHPAAIAAPMVPGERRRGGQQRSGQQASRQPNPRDPDAADPEAVALRWLGPGVSHGVDLP